MERINLSVLTNLFRFLIEEESINDVTAEKDLAMRRFNRRRRIKWLFEFAAVFFVLAQSSGYWIPIFAAIFRSHLFIFALFNSIIAAVYALSARTSRSPPEQQTDLYHEFVATSRKIAVAAESPPPKPIAAENVEKALAVVVVKAKIQIHHHHQRTRSESFNSRSTTAEAIVGEETRREFRRSYTEVRRKLTAAPEKAKAVSGMSDEDFNRRIEDFIAAQKLIQQEEFKEERKTQRFDVTLATTVCQ